MNCCSIIIRTKANYHLSSHRFIFLTKCIEHKQEIINIFSAVFSRQRETRIPIQISLLYWHHIDQRPKQPPNQQFLENRIQKEKESYSNHPFSPLHLLSNKLLPTFQLQHNQDRFTTSPPLPNTTASESNPFPVDFPWTPPLTSATTQLSVLLLLNYDHHNKAYSSLHHSKPPYQSLLGELEFFTRNE